MYCNSAMIPTLMGRDWWDAWTYPSRITDQCFACHLSDDDLLPRRFVRGFFLRPRTQANEAASGQSEVMNNNNQFQVGLDVNQFKLEELKVKVVDNFVVIHGKHEEKTDDHGFVSREFTRRYMLPKACEMETVSSSFGNGVLAITAPKKVIEESPKQERNIPISKVEKLL